MKLLGCSVVLLAACGPRGGGTAAPGPAATQVTVTLDGGDPGDAVLVAYQDGDGPWQLAEGAGGVYRLAVAEGSYGVLTACRQRGTSPMVEVQHYTVAETDQVRASNRCDVATSMRFGGEVRGLQDEVGFVSSSFNEEPVDPRTQRYHLDDRPGRRDLIVVAARDDGAVRSTSRVAIVRDVELVDAGTAIDVDLATAALPPLHRAVVIAGAGAGEALSVRSAIKTGNGAHATLSTDQAAPFELQLVPDAALLPGDVAWVQVLAEQAGALRSSARIVDADGALSLTLGPPLGEVAIALADGPDTSVWPRASWPVHPEATEYTVSYQGAWDPTGDNGGDAPAWTVRVSAGWLAARGEPSYQLPVLHHLDGWIRRDLRRGVAFEWSVVALSLPIGTTAYPPAGVEAHAAHRFGDVIP